MGVVHHASYIVWLEQGRTELLRACGTSYRAIEAAGYFVVLTDLQARYLAPARYDDVVIVRARLDGLRSRGLSFAYELRLAESGAPLLTARTEHIFVGRSSGRPTRAPADLLELLRGMYGMNMDRIERGGLEEMQAAPSLPADQ